MTLDLLIDVPEVIETPRLILRCPRPGDGAEINRAVIESLPELRPWMKWADHAPTPEENEGYMREALARFIQRQSLQYLMFLKDTPTTLVGSTGFHSIDWQVPLLEIGYWMRTSFAGQGYMTEAVVGQCQMAFDKLNAQRLQIICDRANTRSAAVARRAGFELEGIMRHSARRPLTGELNDDLLFSRIREEKYHE